MEVDEHQSPHPSRSASTSVLRRLSTDSVDPERTGSATESHLSEDTALALDSALQTSSEPFIIALSLPPLSLSTSAPRQHDESRQLGPRDSGVDTSTPTIRRSGHSSISSPNMPPLMPPEEDRPDLWRNGFDPPTFRPRIEGVDAATQWRPIDRIEGVPIAEDAQNRPRPQPHGVRRVFAFLGYGTGNRYRKELVALIWTLSFGFIQFAVTLAMIIYSNVHRSPKQPSISEWTACDKPLGLWSCFWIVKIALDCCMTYWGWTREWKTRQRGQNRTETDVEQGASDLDATSPVDPNSDAPALGSVDRHRRRLEASSPHSRLYSRLSLLLSLIIISWFLTSNILVFTSLATCRFAAPHLWWLVFSLLCLQYLVILEVFATALIVFIIGPLIYLFWSIILICLGRHPMQNPHFISPEIGKVSRSVVDQIPLVLYIPSPPDDEKKSGATTGDMDTAVKLESINTPRVGAEHTYPPKQPAPKRRFTFLSRKSSKSVAGTDNTGKSATLGEKSGIVWEDCWESGEFPFVRLDANRASCAICLLDFEEPKRRVARDVIRSWARKNKEGEGVPSENKSERDKEAGETSCAGTEGASSSNQAPTRSEQPEVQQAASVSDDLTDEDGRSLRLEDAGEGAQPLRLLQCGHAFHKTCIDPWLIDVSGRCPTCQRPVTVPDLPKKKRNRNGSQ